MKLVEPGGARSRFSHIWPDHPAYSENADAVKAMMAGGKDKAAPPGDVAKVILAAANDPGERLRYAATGAAMLFGLHRVLPARMFRKLVSKVFGLSR